MAKKVESIPRSLGQLRKGLTEAGFTSDQAFWIIQDLIRKGATPTALVVEEAAE
jgi:hypothetical protein